MTTLLLASQRFFFHTAVRTRAERTEKYFFAANRMGVVTVGLAAMIGICIGVYVVMLVFGFNLGMQLRHAAAVRAQEEQDVKNLDVALREREANFATRYAAILADMEKVSSIIYLDSDGVAMRRAR